MNAVPDDMDRAIAFHMGVNYLPDDAELDALDDEARGEQERIEAVVQGFVERARGISPLEPARELVESLERQLAVLQNVVKELSEPVKKAEQDLAARKALHDHLQQELARLMQALKSKGINLSHTVRKAGGGRR